MLQYRTSDGDTVDYVAWKHYGTLEGKVVEIVLEANHGLADLGPVLGPGVLINLPVIEAAGVAAGVRLWD